MTASMLETWFREKKVVVMIGAGGVGKTTCAAALSFLAASYGARVGLLSIDPAQRLADALGMSLGSNPTAVEWDPPITSHGSLEAAMIDQSQVFDDMVRRHAPSASVAQKILDHPIYQAASTKLAGPLEYMALAQLQSMIDTGRYDLIVLDTPPDTQALDFLSRPNVLAGFAEHRVMNWLVRPFHVASRFGMGRLLSAGEKLMGGVAKVTGLQALKLVAEFLVLIQQVIEGFQRSSEQVHQTLSSEDTGFLLVTAAQRQSLDTAGHLAQRLAALGFHLNGVAINRCLPAGVAAELAALQDSSKELHASALWSRWQSESDLVQRFLESPTVRRGMVMRIDEYSQVLDSQAALWELSSLMQKGVSEWT